MNMMQIALCLIYLINIVYIVYVYKGRVVLFIFKDARFFNATIRLPFSCPYYMEGLFVPSLLILDNRIKLHSNTFPARPYRKAVTRVTAMTLAGI